MDTTTNNRPAPLNLDLITLASPPRQSRQPPLPSQFRPSLDEKAPAPRQQHPSIPSLPSSAPASAQRWSPYTFTPDTASSYRYPASSSSSQFIRSPAGPGRSSTHAHKSPRRASKGVLPTLRPWLPVIMYALTSLGFVVAFALYRTELFEFLDELSLYLRADEQYGHAVLFLLIFLTTIPPFPLYSTLIILSGYTFGAWTGAIISYFAALSGALVVFVVSRHLLRGPIERWLQCCTTIKRVVRAIDKRPKLLFLIRLAPYPYNVMNCLLAASPTLTLHTYTVCTALSLFKVIIHTSIGASIHSFSAAHSQAGEEEEDDRAYYLKRTWTIGGIVLCVLILVYLSLVARRAVDDELDDAPVTARDAEETRGFLEGDASESDIESARPMAETPFRPLVPYRASFSVERHDSDAEASWR